MLGGLAGVPLPVYRSRRASPGPDVSVLKSSDQHARGERRVDRGTIEHSEINSRDTSATRH